MSDPNGREHRERVVRLYREFGPVVYRRCVRLLGDMEAARDATQEVFVKLLREEGSFDRGDGALRWIHRVTTHHCLNLRRDRRRWARLTGGSAEAALEVATTAAAPPADRQLAREVLGRFDAATRAVAVGVLVTGMERDEVASELGISRRTVHRRLARFLAGARRLVKKDEP
jgi:RNA polymerase sigma-70 factor, ECF subfamily